MRVQMSPAAAALYRALVTRAGSQREQVLMTSIRSVDWHSLTLSGERHEIDLRLAGSGASAAAEALCNGLEEAEFAIPGHFVADIAQCGPPRQAADGSVEISLEALTIAD